MVLCVESRLRDTKSDWVHKWQYVPGEMNHADPPSRGCQAKELLDSRWWEGPDWLRGDQNSWPNFVGNFNEKEIHSELKKSIQHSMFSQECQTDLKIVENFSSYTKLINRVHDPFKDLAR